MNVKIFTQSEQLSDGSEVWNVILVDEDGRGITLNLDDEHGCLDLLEELNHCINVEVIV